MYVNFVLSLCATLDSLAMFRIYVLFFFALNNVISFTDAIDHKVTRTSTTNHVIGGDCCDQTSR